MNRPASASAMPVWSCASALSGCAARSGSSNCDRGLAVAMLAQESGQAIAQPRIVRRQRQTRAILWLDQWRLALFRQHARQIGARMGVQTARPRDAVQDRRGRIRLTLRADRKTEQQQRLDISAIAVEQLAADALRLSCYRPLSSSASASCNRDSRCAASKSAPPPPCCRKQYPPGVD